MNITMDDTKEDLSAVDAREAHTLITKLMLLDDDARDTLRQLSIVIIDTLAAKEGALVLMSDVKGNGVAQIVAAGNPLLIPALLYAATDAADAMFKKPETSAVQ